MINSKWMEWPSFFTNHFYYLISSSWSNSIRKFEQLFLFRINWSCRILTRTCIYCSSICIHTQTQTNKHKHTLIYKDNNHTCTKMSTHAHTLFVQTNQIRTQRIAWIWFALHLSKQINKRIKSTIIALEHLLFHLISHSCSMLKLTPAPMQNSSENSSSKFFEMEICGYILCVGDVAPLPNSLRVVNWFN